MGTFNKIIQLIVAIILFLLGWKNVAAQQSYSKQNVGKHNSIESTENSIPSLKALQVQLSEKIELDGKLDESIWQQTPVATGFIQRTPNDGKPATEKTVARVIYTEDTIFIKILSKHK